MTRAEHLAWCKQRALEYVDRGEVVNAVASMLSDLSKHPETESSGKGIIAMTAFSVKTPDEARRWIEGFN